MVAKLGRYPGALIPICIVVLFLAWRYPQWRVRLILSVVSLLISWRAADYFQHVFARHRPLEWVVKHEATFRIPARTPRSPPGSTRS